MRKFNNILIPIDFSTASMNALKYGAQIAKYSNSNVHVIHAFRLIDHNEIANNNQAIDLTIKLRNSLNKQLSDLKKSYFDLNNVKSSFGLHIGFPDDVIDTFLQKNSMDIIIMGTTGRGNSNALFGSTISNVVNTNTTSVLALKKEIIDSEVNEAFLDRLNQNPPSQLDANTEHGFISIPSEDFNKLKPSSEQNEKIKKALTPIFIYASN